MYRRRTSSVLALLSIAILAFGGSVFHHVLLHRAPEGDGARLASLGQSSAHSHADHSHAGHAERGHAHSPCGGHAPCSDAETAEPGRPHSDPSNHSHPAHGCAICAVLAAGGTLPDTAPELVARPLVARPLAVAPAPHVPSIDRAAPQLPRAPPSLLMALPLS